MINTPIEIDKYRNLRYDFNAMVELETTSKMHLTAFLVPLSKPSFGAIRLLLWLGLKWEDPSLKITDAGNLAEEWIEKSGSDMGGLVEVLIDALVNSGWLCFDKPDDFSGDGQGEVTGASTN